MNLSLGDGVKAAKGGSERLVRKIHSGVNCNRMRAWGCNYDLNEPLANVISDNARCCDVKALRIALLAYA